MNNYKKTLYTLWQLRLPIIKNTALFRSFNGQYNDNPKYVCEQLHKMLPDLKIYWAISDGAPQSFPEYVKTVQIDGKEYLKLAARAQVAVDNYAGCRSYFLDKKNPLKRFICGRLSRKRKGQFNLSTWHGTPLKHVSLDEPRFKNAKFKKAYLCADFVVAGNEFTARAYKTALGLSEKRILQCGTPRNDLFFKKNSPEIKKKLGLPENKKIALYAPTFRLNVENSGINQIKQMNLSALAGALSEKFGGEWAFVFRSHNLVMNEIKNREEPRGALGGEIINGNEHDDMAEYLACADALITDYSSSMFDFALSGKPCFLLCPDLDEYKNSERGFYTDICSLPFCVSRDFNGLLASIRDFNGEEFKRGVAAMLSELGNAENGSASETLAQMVAERLK